MRKTRGFYVPVFNKNWVWAGVPIIAIAILLFTAPAYWPQYRGYVYIAVLLLLAIHLALVGWLVNNRPMGVFIDSRNRISLSKLQAGAWTVVVLSGFATIAAFNAGAEIYQDSSVTALAIVIPGELLLAMGISATSLVAAPALLSLKAKETPAAEAEPDAQKKMGDSVTISGTGKVLNKESPHEASWGDLMTGDELGNAGSPDLGKIQQGLITLLLLGCYGAYIFAELSSSAEKLSSLPALDKSFVWLMGISHTSYLAYKAAPHTESETKS